MEREPIAWAVYGGRTGILRYVERDAERVRELVEEGGYEARPLFESSPPADDVREALARTFWEAAVGDNPEGVPGESWEELLEDEPVWAQGYYFQADAVLAAFEVRPYGTVTDAEEAWKAWKGDCMTRPPKASFMAGWNAAREARS